MNIKAGVVYTSPIVKRMFRIYIIYVHINMDANIVEMGAGKHQVGQRLSPTIGIYIAPTEMLLNIWAPGMYICHYVLHKISQSIMVNFIWIVNIIGTSNLSEMTSADIPNIPIKIQIPRLQLPKPHSRVPNLIKTHLSSRVVTLINQVNDAKYYTSGISTSLWSLWCLCISRNRTG